MASPDLPIVLYHYIHSPNGRRIVWYLTLRGIPYTQCLQPHMLPRPDLALIGVKYRLIPFVTVGRDVYLNTRFALDKLEALYPPSEAHPALGGPAASSPEAVAIRAVLSRLSLEGGLMRAVSGLMPPGAGQLADPRFLRDRADMMGIPRDSDRVPKSFLSPEAMKAGRPAAMCEMRDAFAIMESLLADGRDWVLKTPGPSLADIEIVWVFVWLLAMPGAMPEDVASKEMFPRAFSWVARFLKTVKAHEQKLGQPASVDGQEARDIILNAPFAEEEGVVDAHEARMAAGDLKKGDPVVLFPTDVGMLHKDVGKLVSMTAKETVVESQAQGGTVRLHAPRSKFKVQKASAGSSSL